MTFDLESGVLELRVTWATSVPILVFLDLSVRELHPMYATDVRQTDIRQKHRLMPPPYGGEGIIMTVEKHIHTQRSDDEGTVVRSAGFHRRGKVRFTMLHERS